MGNNTFLCMDLRGVQVAKYRTLASFGWKKSTILGCQTPVLSVPRQGLPIEELCAWLFGHALLAFDLKEVGQWLLRHKGQSRMVSSTEGILPEALIDNGARAETA